MHGQVGVVAAEQNRVEPFAFEIALAVCEQPLIVVVTAGKSNRLISSFIKFESNCDYGAATYNIKHLFPPRTKMCPKAVFKLLPPFLRIRLLKALRRETFVSFGCITEELSRSELTLILSHSSLICRASVSV